MGLATESFFESLPYFFAGATHYAGGRFVALQLEYDALGKGKGRLKTPTRDEA